MTHPTPALIHAQKKGHELPNQITKVEYQLRTKTGATACAFEDQDLIQPYLDRREEKWGKAAPALELHRVTTITEKLS